MSDEVLQSDLNEPQSNNVVQKSKSKKPLFITLGILSIVIVFLAIVTFIPEKYLEDETVPTPTPTTSTTIPTEPVTNAPKVEDQLILKFKKGVTDAQINELLQQYNATIVKRIEALDRIVVKVPEGQGDAMLDAFKKDNLIEEVQPDYIYKASFAPNDTNYNNQWWLKNTGQNIEGQTGTANADIHAEAAWNVTKGNNGVKIAILDTGIDQAHPDIPASKIAASQDFTGEGIDDKNGHGTHVAGVVAALTNNLTGIAGTCPECQLVIGKVLNSEGKGSSSNVASAITWAAGQGNKVIINMSLSAYAPDTVMQEAVSSAWGKGAVIVAAAGNTDADAENGRVATDPNYPAAYPNVVSVAATDNKDQKAIFSHYGTWVSVAAPGEFIFSTLPTHEYTMKTTHNTALNYDYLSGTSQATPIVSGVAGLIWSTSCATSNADVVQKLYNTADDIGHKGEYWNYGRINAEKAVSCSTPSLAPPLAIPSSPAPVVTSIFSCMGSGSCPPSTVPVTQPGGSPISGQPVNPNPSIPSTSGKPIQILPFNLPDPSQLDRRDRRKARRYVKKLLRDIRRFIRSLPRWIRRQVQPFFDMVREFLREYLRALYRHD